MEMEPNPNEWDAVIKVKYGDTLRRFSCFVADGGMEHDMRKLRAKIINFFKFSPDADFILTYIDEDGDIVTLDGDDELRDAVINQRLNPLRINVQLKTDTDGSSESRSVETTPPLTDSQHPVAQQLPIHSAVAEALIYVPEPFRTKLSNLSHEVLKTASCAPALAQFVKANPPPTNSQQQSAQPLPIHSAVAEALNSVPEPFRTTLSNLSHDVVKTASTAPHLAPLVEYFSKLGLSNSSLPSYDSFGESSGKTSSDSTHLVDLNVSDEPKSSNYPIPVPTVLPTSCVLPVPGNMPKLHESGNMTQGVGARASTCVDLNLDVPLYPKVGETSSVNDLLTTHFPFDDQLHAEKEGGNARRDGKSVVAAELPSVLSANQTVNQNSQNLDTPWPSLAIYGYGTPDRQFPMNAAVPFTSQMDSTSHGDVPISKNVTPHVPPPIWSVPMYPYKRFHSYRENTPHTFHSGVQCDGCGMHPIVGPRFKSNVKEDYDLCHICFVQMGNEADYTRIERAAYRAPRPFKEFHYPHSRHLRLASSNGFRGCGVRAPRAKLESRFIQDVTVMDGTAMAPLTHFTKIWRMRNNGTVAWPFGSQLVWVGGDQFGDRRSAELEIPVNGYPVDGEIDIAVDFTAPSRPGRYVSYWRMASPSGQKFGQRVWVLIQVDNSLPNSAAGSGFHADLNLNLPPESSSRNGPDTIDVNADPLAGVCPEPNDPTTNTPTVAEVVKSLLPSGLVEDISGINSGLAQPNVDHPFTGKPLIDFPASSSFDASPAAPVDQGNQVEQTLLKELEDMGFKQIDLNKEVLRLNEYDLEQSVDDLCGFAEWDPLLNELQEMGFSDKELNKKLLIKNGGSIKRVVLDLINGERGE